MAENEQFKQKILNGRYRIVQRLASRPRLTLYLGRRLPQRQGHIEQSSSNKLSHKQEPLVAIRELLLADFSPITRVQVEAAVVEEFASPGVFNSSHLPSIGDRAWREDDRLYLAVQLNEPLAPPLSFASHMPSSEPVTLDRLLLDSPMWPDWVDVKTALAWGIQLCRMVARLHHQGVVLGNLNPSSILIYERDGMWTPLLLPCWPPAPCYWQGGRGESNTYQMFVAHDFSIAFPLGRSGRDDAFAAPEMLHEARTEVTERADIYSLGAILYLLLSHYAPICAASRASSEQNIYSPIFDTPRGATLLHPQTYSISTPAVQHQGTQGMQGTRTRFERRRQTHQSRMLRNSPGMYNMYDEQSGEEQSLELLDLRTLNSNVPIQLAEIVLRALQLEPNQRFSSAFALVEALEAIQNNMDI